MTRREEWEKARNTNAERLHDAWDLQEDWWGVCRKCGKRVRGTPGALKDHRCNPDGEVDNGPTR